MTSLTLALRAVCFALPLLLSAQALAQAPTRRASIGIWPWLTNTSINSDAANIVARTAAEGFDEIYIHVFSSTGIGTGDLRIADEAGTWGASWGNVRPLVTLSQFTALAHAQNLRVYGVINCFYDTTPTPDSQVHRDYLAYDVVNYLLNSFDAQGRDRYGLDGITLDRVRYYGGNHTRGPVTDFLTKVRAVAGAKEVHAFVPANAYILDGPTYDANFNSYNYVIAEMESEFGLHYPTVAPLLDVMLPMAYTADGHVYGTNYTRMEAYVGVATRYLQLAAIYGGATETQIVPALRAWNDTSGTTTPASLAASIRGALNYGGSGFNVFRYYTAVNQPTWWSAMAPFVVARPNAPAARLTATVDGLTLEADLRTSSDFDEPFGNLRFRLDLDANGAFDTLASANAQPELLLAGPGRARLAAEVRDSTGLVDVAEVEVVAGTTLSFSSPWLYAGAGGTLDLRFHGGRAADQHLALFLLSTSGATPGTPIGGVLLPLNWDPLTQLSLQLSNTPSFANFFAPLDANGDATAQLYMPAGAIPPSMIGVRVYAAVLGLEPQYLLPRFVSNTTAFFILP